MGVIGDGAVRFETGPYRKNDSGGGRGKNSPLQTRIPAFAGMGKEESRLISLQPALFDNTSDFKRASFAFEGKPFGVLVECPGQYQDTLNKPPKAANAKCNYRDDNLDNADADITEVKTVNPN